MKLFTRSAFAFFISTNLSIYTNYRVININDKFFFQTKGFKKLFSIIGVCAISVSVRKYSDLIEKYNTVRNMIKLTYRAYDKM